MRIEYIYLANGDEDAFTVINPQGAEKNIIEYNGITIASLEIAGENEVVAQELSELKTTLEELLKYEKTKFYLYDDGVSQYYNKKLYPLCNSFERKLRQIVYMLSIKTENREVKEFAESIVDKDFGDIYEMFFTDDVYYKNIKEIVGKKRRSKHDLLLVAEKIEENTLWDKLCKEVGIDLNESIKIPNNFDNIRSHRNAVMHAHNLYHEDYTKMKNDLEQAIYCLDGIIGKILYVNIDEAMAALELFAEKAGKLRESIMKNQDLFDKMRQTIMTIGEVCFKLNQQEEQIDGQDEDDE